MHRCRLERQIYRSRVDRTVYPVSASDELYEHRLNENYFHTRVVTGDNLAQAQHYYDASTATANYGTDSTAATKYTTAFPRNEGTPRPLIVTDRAPDSDGVYQLEASDISSAKRQYTKQKIATIGLVSYRHSIRDIAGG